MTRTIKEGFKHIEIDCCPCGGSLQVDMKAWMDGQQVMFQATCQSCKHITYFSMAWPFVEPTAEAEDFLALHIEETKRERTLEDWNDESGYETQDAFVAFIYELMRDEVTPGTIENIVQKQYSPRINAWVLTNFHVAKYAEEVVDKLKQQTKNILKKSSE